MAGQWKEDWSLENSEHPECCGIRILHGFPEDDLEDYCIKRSLDYAKTNGNSFGLPGMIQAAINREQKGYFHKDLVAAGFKQVSKALNPKTGNWIYLYVALVAKPKKTLKRRRF